MTAGPRLAFAVSVAAALLVPGLADAQAYQCSAPARVPPIHPELPSDREPQRLLPIGGYTLAISWAPNYCREHGDDAAARFECGSANRFGWTLHGLWPDGVGPEWPQYCHVTPLLSKRVIRRNLCATPSAQLLQHEWAKHGTCMAPITPSAYFARSTGLYAQLRYPDMEALSRAPLTAGRLAQAMAASNPGIAADAIRVTADRQGWLSEIWFCLGKDFAYRRCRAGSGGLPDDATVRIWRGSR